METQEPAKSFLYDILLPKVELPLWVIAIGGFIASLYQLTGWATWLIVGFSNLAIVSFLSAFSPYNSIDRDEPYFEPIATQNERNKKETSFFLDSLAPKIAGIAGGVVLIGTLFKLMFWAGYSNMLLVGTAWLLIIVLVMAFNQRMNMRAFMLAILGSSMLYVSSETLMHQVHRDDPELVALMVYQMHHPHERAAAEAVRIHVNQKRIQR